MSLSQTGQNSTKNVILNVAILSRGEVPTLVCQLPLNAKQYKNLVKTWFQGNK